MAAGAVITVVVATFGDDGPGSWWWDQAAEAVRSAVAQEHAGVVEVVTVSRPTLAEARNAGAGAATNDWLVFLDADDRLAPGYLAAMLDEVAFNPGVPLLIQPATRGWDAAGHVDDTANLIPAKTGGLYQGNHLVIGTCVPRDLFLDVGGFDSELIAYEDWDLWLRCYRAGARITAAPDAEYLVQQRPDGRNTLATIGMYHQIRARYT